MNLKKIPYYLFLALLTAGASLTLGFLSFSGALALWPSIGLASAFFVLSMAYEAEIILANVKSALDKLFMKRDYLKQRMAKEFLLEHFPENDAEIKVPFLKDYATLLTLEDRFKKLPQNAANRARLKSIRKTLKQSEKYFADVLFPENANAEFASNPYEKALRAWILNNGGEDFQHKRTSRKWYYRIALAFSIVTSVFMGLGTIYLMAATPIVVMGWPFLVLASVMGLGAVFSGAAYGYQTFNSITDMINNDTLSLWYAKIKNDLYYDFGLRSFSMASLALVLTSLGLALTVLTAGTWWTIIKEAPNVFKWMRQVPSFIKTVAMPFFLGLSSLVFNLENSAETLESLDNSAKNPDNSFRNVWKSMTDGLANIWNKENLFQILNPFRLVVKLTFTPIRILLFMGHLLSIAVTADRVPGIPEIVSALINFVMEGFTDGSYFFDLGSHSNDPSNTIERIQERLDGGVGHNHHKDIPTTVLQLLFTPLFLCATLWHFAFSRNSYSLDTWKEAKRQHFSGSEHENHEEHPSNGTPCQPSYADVASYTPAKLSSEFKTQMALHRLHSWRKKHQVVAQSPQDQAMRHAESRLRQVPSEKPVNDLLKTPEFHTAAPGRLFEKLERIVECDAPVAHPNAQR